MIYVPWVHTRQRQCARGQNWQSRGTRRATAPDFNLGRFFLGSRQNNGTLSSPRDLGGLADGMRKGFKAEISIPSRASPGPSLAFGCENPPRSEWAITQPGLQPSADYSLTIPVVSAKSLSSLLHLLAALQWRWLARMRPFLCIRLEPCVRGGPV